MYFKGKQTTETAVAYEYKSFWVLDEVPEVAHCLEFFRNTWLCVASANAELIVALKHYIM